MSSEIYNPSVVSDMDTPFVVDAITRDITNKNPEKKILIQGDHNSERFTFEIPRFIEGRDVAKCNVVEVHYVNVEKGTKRRSTGVYTVTDLDVYPFVNDILTCSWLISSNATKYSGNLSFMLRFKEVEDTKIKYAWSTNVYSDMYIAESLDSDETFMYEYVDIIEQWKESVMKELYSYVDQTVEGNVHITQIDINQTDISNLKTKQTTLESRMNTFAALKSGSTTGDAELQDIRVRANGTTHETAGEAVRAMDTDISALLQKNQTDNPLQPIAIDCHRYYRGSDVIHEISVLPSVQYNAANLTEYLTIEHGGVNNNCCLGGRFVTPMPVYSNPNGEYVILIKTDKQIKGNVYIGHYMNWAPNNTNWHKWVTLEPGVNMIRVEGADTFRDAGHTEYKHVYFGSTDGDFSTLGVTVFDMYIIKGDALIAYIEKAIKDIGNNAPYAIESGHAVNASNAGVSRLPITGYISNTDKEPQYGTYTIEELPTGYRFILDESHYIEAASNKWFQGFVTDLGVKSEAIKRTLYIKVTCNDPNGTKTGLSRLALHNTTYNWNGVPINPGVTKVSEVDLSAYADTDHVYLIWGIAAGEHDNPQWFSNRWDFTVETMEFTDGYVIADELKGFDPNPKKRIICWGDSLTAMGGWPEKLAALSGLEVKNCGTGGEGSTTITARQGADCIIIDNLTIPADKTAVKVTDYATRFTTYMGHVVAPLLQSGGHHVNPCMIGDVKGELKWTGSSYNDASGIWTFTRSESGEEIVIDRPTHLTTFADREYNNGYDIHVYFIGTNDGAFDVDTMIDRLRLMIDHSKTHEYLVLGLTRIQSDGYKEKFKAAFGRKWLDLHGYLVAYGLEDSEMPATAEDKAAMEADLVPPSLLMDPVHFTDKTRELIGIQVYNRMRDLHYFE